jgi:hypothetical protein
MIQLRTALSRFIAIAVAVASAGAQAPPLRPWPEYQVILWTSDSVYAKRDKLPLFVQRLREMGASAGMVHAAADPTPLVEAKLPYYCENLVNRGLCLKWNSQVADWDKWVTAWKDRRDEAGLVREYCFDDAKWRASAREDLEHIVKRNGPNAPLLYDIRDEISVTMSGTPFDYDFDPRALSGFREWLKTRYASLDALNAEWDAKFSTWDEVKPFTTDRIKNRMASGESLPSGNTDWSKLKGVALDPEKPLNPLERWNFAPWCDHRTYMDVSLAATLADLRRAAHRIDAATPVGIEGTQMPSAFGGYDLWRLAQVIDWVEPYDIADARSILGSFMPKKLFFSTVGEKDARAARRRLWHLLLQGDRGCFVWWSDDCIDVASDDYALTPRAKTLAPVLAEMRSPLAQLFMRAEREIDPIAIHYSQASIQVAWLVDSAVDGSTWLRRFSSYEAEHGDHARIRSECVKKIEDAGYTPFFVSSAQIEADELRECNRLVLPCSYALSDEEVWAIRGLSHWPGCAIEFSQRSANGVFDQHGRMRAVAEFPFRDGTIGREFSTQTAADVRADFRRDIPLAVEVPIASEVSVQRYRLGNARLIALERNVGYAMGEDLQQRAVAKRLEEPVSFDAHLASKAHVYDLRSGKSFGLTDTVHIALDPWQPTLLALTQEELPEGDVVARLNEQAVTTK